MSPPRLFDRKTYARRRARAAGRESFLAREAVETLAMRIAAVNRRFVHGLDLSSRDQVFASLAPLAERWTRTSLFPATAADAVADEEALPFAPGAFDLIVSALSLHAVNDLPGALAQIRNALKPDGLFVAALFGGATLTELRESLAAGESEILGGASPRIAPFADTRDLGSLLQRAGFALPVTDSERTIVHYGALSTLFDDLRALGETNALAERSRRFLRRDVLGTMLAHYASTFGNSDGRSAATFEIVYLTGWCPHPQQQQPLRPGSAKTRLADALHTDEISAGEHAGPESKDG